MVLFRLFLWGGTEGAAMSGHSKWSTIKRKKGATDAKRGKIFTRCIHEIAVAAKEGGGDPNANPKLRLALEKAKAANMPNDNITRAIKRATGELKGQEQFELVYEGYGPGGTAILVEALTDNKNRTAGEVRHAFSRNGGSLGESGCVAWMFEKKGLIALQGSLVGEEELMELAIDAGAEDVSLEEEMWELTCERADFENLKGVLEARFSLDLAEVKMLPKSRIELGGKEAQQMVRLLEALEDLDDVLDVSANCDFVD